MKHEKLASLGGPPTRSTPWPKWPRADEGTLAAVREVLDSSRWALSGASDGRSSFEQRFAASFAAFNEIDYCTPTTSGTSALTVAMQALGVGPKDEVLVPGLTWVACASAVANLGAVPVLVDVDADTLAMSAAAARGALTARTSAILVVHPFCTVADLDAFLVLGADSGLPVIEDCSQAHGARWRGKRVGTFGDAGCFSMQQSKLLTAGEGGAVITADRQRYELMEQLRSDGRLVQSGSSAGQLELLEVGGARGRNFCLSELQSAVLLDRLGHLEAENHERNETAAYLRTALKGITGVSTLPCDSRVTTPVYYNFVLRFDLDQFANNSIDAICRALRAELGTGVHPVYTPLDQHRLLNAYRDARSAWTPIPAAALPMARQARRTCATLVHSTLLAGERSMDDIVVAIEKVRVAANDLVRLDQEAGSQAF